ncbi:FKBP-type peptidyl-prolyl cis-trans isomerase [Nesterenkonia xinjiangensis]|nr:FKBP-type peptidyl-prolyl cis-trans isomerase [Nesterenkonia xinjiangensis]
MQYALAAPAVLLLAGCSSDGLGDTSALSGIDLHFTDEGVPEVLISNPVESDEESSLILSQGDGDELDPEQILHVSSATVDPASGAVQQENFSEDTPSLLFLPMIQEQSEFIYDSLVDTGATVGSDIALYEPGSAETGGADSLVILRIDDQVPAHATGEEQEQSGDLPEITSEVGEAPTLPAAPDEEEAPEETESEVLIAGEGAEIGATDQVVVRYTGWTWSDGEVFDSAWPGVTPPDSEQAAEDGTTEDEEAEDDGEDDEAASVPPASFPLDNLVDGWAEGLEGKHVGDRVLLVIPPESGYGEAEGHDLQDETLIFVVDLIASAPAPEQTQEQMPEQPELTEEELEELEEMMQEQGGEDADADDTDADDTDDD